MSLYIFVVKYQGPLEGEGVKNVTGRVHLSHEDFVSGEFYSKIQEELPDHVGKYEILVLQNSVF
jgi:hypothetical protein